MDLAQTAGQFTKDLSRLDHGRVDLARMCNVETKAGVRQAFKEPSKFRRSSPYRLPFVHILDKK
jgi:hypothetical protein